MTYPVSRLTSVEAGSLFSTLSYWVSFPFSTRLIRRREVWLC